MSTFPILALDVGTKRVGIAYMDYASAVSTEKYILPRESNKALKKILSLLSEKKIQTLVVGLPLGTNQQKTKQCEDVEKFCRRIERRYPIQTDYVDEYLSSVEAEERTAAGNKIDDHAAEIILKRYLVLKGLLPGYL